MRSYLQFSLAFPLSHDKKGAEAAQNQEATKNLHMRALWLKHFYLLAMLLSAVLTVHGQERLSETYIKELKSSDPTTREGAALSLGNIYMDVSESVQAAKVLLVASKDRKKKVRQAANASLGNIKDRLKVYKAAAIPHLVTLLKEGDIHEKQLAMYFLIKSVGTSAIPTLAELATGDDPWVRFFAVYGLGEMEESEETPSQTRVINVTLYEVLNGEPDSVVKLEAAFAYVSREIKTESIIPVLITGLRMEDPDRRQRCASYLGNFGPAASAAVNDLAAVLKDPDADVRAAAAVALGKIGAAARPTVPALLALLDTEGQIESDTAREVPQFARGYYIYQYNDLPVAEAENRIKPLRRWAASLECQLRVLESLISLEANPNDYLTDVLRLLLKESKSIPFRIDLQDDDEYQVVYDDVNVGQHVPPLLGKLGVRAVRPLLDLFENDKNQLARLQVLKSFGEIGLPAKEAIPLLIRVVKTGEAVLGPIAVGALGNVGAADPEKCIPVLIEALDSRVLGLHTEAAAALVVLAKALDDAKDVRFISPLRKALESLNKSDAKSVKEAASEVRRSVDHLNDLWWRQIIPKWVKENKTLLFAACGWLALLITWLVLFALRPFWLFRVNEVLAGLEYKLPSPFGFSLPLRHVVVSSPFHYHPRTLDAWVSRHVGTVRENFSKKLIVAERNITLPIPAVLNGTAIQTNDLKAIRRVFSGSMSYVLIPGEGGSGKTSLAGQLSRYAVAADGNSRLRGHFMLPVFLEPHVGTSIDSKESLLTFVQDQLRILTGKIEHPPETLVHNLLRRGRILLVIDGLSEMGEARARIISSISQLPANAVIITSRAEEPLNDLPKSVLRPLKIKGNYLSDFLSAYLAEKGKRHLFADDEFFDACWRLSIITGEREMTVLLAKLFAEHLLTVKGDPAPYELPANVPDLMLTYVNNLNRIASDEEPGDDVVQWSCKAIAWECLKKGYRPQPARRTDLIKALGGEEKALPILKYLEDRLKIVQTSDVERNYLRFLLDPLSEYLAALYLIQHLGGEDVPWLQVISGLKDRSVGTDGFLIALYDCCFTKGDGEVPGVVINELNELVGAEIRRSPSWTAEMYANKLIRELNSLDKEVRAYVVKALRVTDDSVHLSS